MHKPSQDSSILQPGRRSSATGAKLSPVIEHLQRRFVKFRRSHPPRTPIPNELRSAVVAALGQGIKPTQLRQCCRLSGQQLKQWQTDHGKTTACEDLSIKQARVFSVVDDLATPDADVSNSSRGQELELRIDGWSVCVRRVGR